MAKEVAICRAPGGLPGLDAHVGVWVAMEEAGIQPTWLSGCSAGAIVSALQATGMVAARAERILRALESGDVVKRRRFWKLRIFSITHFLKPKPIRRLLNRWLPADFEDLEIPLTVSATVMGQTAEWPYLFNRYSERCLRQAVLASMSIAGVWPYAAVPDREWRFSDGGTTDAIVLPRRLCDENIECWVVNLVKERSYADRDRNMISRLLWNVEKLLELEADETRERVAHLPNVQWLDIDITGTSCLEFDHGLINRAYEQAKEQIGGLQRFNSMPPAMGLPR